MSLRMTTLVDPHRHKLQGCGLTLETWQRAGLHSGSEAEVKDVLGYGGAGPGLVIPYTDDYARVRIDHPGPDGKRYRSPKGKGNHLYVPRLLDPVLLKDPATPLYVTEGELKALKACQEGFPCVALPGVWSWKTRLHGHSLPIPDLDRVTWTNRMVIVVFDSDLADKPAVAWAEHALCRELRHRGAMVYVLRLPDGPRGDKVGLDDYLVAPGPEAFRQLPMVALAGIGQDRPVFLRVSDLADIYLLRVLQPHHRITTGYADLDAVLRGVAPGEVLQILGRSGVGKTAFALNLVERMTATGQLPTLIFSLEQPGPELFERMASMTLGYAGREIEERTRIEDPVITCRLVEVCQQWHHVVVVDRPCSIEKLDHLLTEAQAGALWADRLRVVVVDYLGLIVPRRATSAYEHTSEAAKALKHLAKTHQVAVVSLCQIGRDGEEGGEPVTIQMARDSGVVEETADYLLGIWRPELSSRLSKEERGKVRGEFKVRVLKNRSGPAPRTVTLRFDSSVLRVHPLVVEAAGAAVSGLN